ncbi:MAG: NPCBM/NEW2 domain-containing protein, partial [Thermoguttaceae bacterium]|nr:NPCBM/NEW2 domain-containing protein [Thermoguttaceae bacterium]
MLFLTPLFANESAVSELTHQTVWLDELDLSLTQCGWKQTQANRSILEGPLVIGDRQFERGVGHHAPGSIVVELPEGNIRFSAEVGVNVDAESAIGDIRFLIYADNEPLWDSGIMTPGEAAKSIDLDLTGHQYVALVVTTGADDYAGDHADWCNAKFDWTPVASSNDSDCPAAPRIIKAMVAENGFIINEADRSSEVKREYFAIQQQLFIDVEKQRSNYYESRYGTGYNGSFQFMTPPPEETVASEAVHPDANVFDTDRDPLDVIIRRTRTLCDYLIENSDEDGFLKPESEALDRLEKTASEVPVDRTSERQKIFRDVFTLRRQIALSNPLLDFSDILFIKRFSCEPDENMGNHMCDQFFGFNALPGGGLFLLKNAFSDSPEAVDLLKDLPVSTGKYILRKKLEGKKLDSTWGFLSPELSFNADEILFAATDTKSPRHLFEWTNDNCYHIFKLKFDPETGKASDLVQLTEGAVNDFDPCFLPSGRIIFISERRGGYGRCHPRIVPSYTLFSMNPDGSDFVMLSPHETNEWQPVVDANGMVLYTRWDYVDRGANNAHHPWITAPDGRDPRAVTGNYNSWAFNRPVFEGNIRPVPGTGLMTATAAAHHGQVYGSLLLINPKIQDDNAMAPMRRITPEQLFPEAEMPQHAAPARYATCYPLSEYFYLCVYDPMARADTPSNSNNYGIYLLDAFGNRTLLYRDPAISCYDPIPVRKNPVPPIVPHQTLVGKPLAPGEEFTPIDSSQLPKMAEMAVMNVYDTTLPFPEGTKIKRLRIVQILPKTTWEADHPRIGYGD